MAPVPPIQRVLAFMIDKMAAWALLGLIIAVTGLDTTNDSLTDPTSAFAASFDATLDSTEFRPMIRLGTTTCGAAVPDTVKAIGALVPEAKISAVTSCMDRISGVATGGRIDFTMTHGDGTQEPGALDISVNGLVFRHIDAFALLCLLGLSSLCLAVFHTTPGKALCGIKVSGKAWAMPLREVIRLSPFLVSVLWGSKLRLSLTEVGIETSWGLIAIAISAALVVGLWVVPVAKDHPLMPWDRIAGTSTVRR
ncbi:hypothetical protein NX862_06535 [Rhodobacter sp. KR11]|uniref:hypothetical protein n=1 Tax=Rhodobacter sp. KR11 TaxID=2974588 RepID=UPI002222B458|nr:hypothetical protein [Rhodobacter sp. KR11]MCW1918401.1 hypothetical protein [Rhodobacter sp. KR11]